MRRRSLLRRIAGVTALLIGSTLPYGFISLLAPNQAWPRRNHLRPPGALPNDDAFVSACIGCGLCGEVCPPRCIKFHSRDGGEGGEGGDGADGEVGAHAGTKILPMRAYSAAGTSGRSEITS